MLFWILVLAGLAWAVLSWRKDYAQFFLLSIAALIMLVFQHVAAAVPVGWLTLAWLFWLVVLLIANVKTINVQTAFNYSIAAVAVAAIVAVYGFLFVAPNATQALPFNGTTGEVNGVTVPLPVPEGTAAATCQPIDLTTNPASNFVANGLVHRDVPAEQLNAAQLKDMATQVVDNAKVLPFQLATKTWALSGQGNPNDVGKYISVVNGKACLSQEGQADLKAYTDFVNTATSISMTEIPATWWTTGYNENGVTKSEGISPDNRWVLTVQGTYQGRPVIDRTQRVCANTPFEGAPPVPGGHTNEQPPHGGGTPPPKSTTSQPPSSTTTKPPSSTTTTKPPSSTTTPPSSTTTPPSSTTTTPPSTTTTPPSTTTTPPSTTTTPPSTTTTPPSTTTTPPVTTTLETKSPDPSDWPHDTDKPTVTTPPGSPEPTLPSETNPVNPTETGGGEVTGTGVPAPSVETPPTSREEIPTPEPTLAPPTEQPGTSIEEPAPPAPVVPLAPEGDSAPQDLPAPPADEPVAPAPAPEPAPTPQNTPVVPVAPAPADQPAPQAPVGPVETAPPVDTGSVPGAGNPMPDLGSSLPTDGGGSGIPGGAIPGALSGALMFLPPLGHLIRRRQDG